MHVNERQCESPRPPDIVSLRFDMAEAAKILRMSRAQLYKRIKSGTLRPQKDGARTYITRVELERYVQACNDAPASSPNRAAVTATIPGESSSSEPAASRFRSHSHTLRRPGKST